MWWLIASVPGLIPKQVWVLIAAAVGLQLVGIDVITPLLDVLTTTFVDPLVRWLESQLTSDLVFW